MLLLRASQIRKYFGPDPVLAGVSLEIYQGDRVGLVGPNGCGKSTLLNILCGELESDGGSLDIQANVHLGYLKQQPDFNPVKTVWEAAEEPLMPLKKMVAEVEEVAAKIANACSDEERHQLEARYDHLHQELDRLDVFETDHRVEPVLEGLGFKKHQFQQPTGELSGGQQNRLMLARLLLSDTELMILDEPSNHLDLESTNWLENYLAKTHRTFLIVSHDRYLLDRVTSRTLELFQGTVDSYVGNYSAYLRQKDERVCIQRKTYEAQQEEIAKLEDFIRRNHYGQKHSQAEDRRKKLERIERVAPPREIFAPPILFPPATRTGDIVVRATNIAKGFTSKLFQEVSFDILRGERWGILGPNGSGKTTLIRCVLGDIPLDAGNATLGQGVKVGYFDQKLNSLDQGALVVDVIRPSDREMHEPERRSHLARFGITGDLVFSRVQTLSGGEKTRVALAKLAAEQVNLLVLDEPTNHLDLWARQALEEALRKYDGTVIVVSHDRYFLNRISDHILAFFPGRVLVIPGGYEDYCHFVSTLAARNQTTSPAVKEAAPPRKETSPPRRKRKFPYRKLEALEADLAQCESSISEIQAKLLEPHTLRNGQLYRQIQKELEAKQEEYSRLFEHWEEASELN